MENEAITVTVSVQLSRELAISGFLAACGGRTSHSTWPAVSTARALWVDLAMQCVTRGWPRGDADCDHPIDLLRAVSHAAHLAGAPSACAIIDDGRRSAARHVTTSGTVIELDLSPSEDGEHELTIVGQPRTVVARAIAASRAAHADLTIDPAITDAAAGIEAADEAARRLAAIRSLTAADVVVVRRYETADDEG